MHCAQLDSPLAAYSAPVFFTSASNSRRGISLRSWLNMLHDAFKVGPLVDGSRCLATRTLHHHQMAQPPILFWTKVGVGALVNWVWSVALVPVLIAWFYFGARSLVADYPHSDSKLTLREGYANSAAAHNPATLWALLVFSVIFVVCGIFIVSTAHETEQQLIGLASAVFFGVAGLAIAYMLWA